ncbi:hypothetical protein QUB47_08360 [Microcoleus sp. AT9_B5]
MSQQFDDGDRLRAEVNFFWVILITDILTTELADRILYHNRRQT